MPSKEEWLVCAAKGLTIPEAARELNVSANAGYWAQKKYGIKFAHHKTKKIKQIEELAKQGYTRKETAKMVKLSIHTVGVYARLFNVSFSRPARKYEKKERNAEIVARATAGEDYATIAKDFNITRSRVSEIVVRERKGKKK